MILGKAFSWGKKMYTAGNFSAKSRMTRWWNRTDRYCNCFPAGTLVETPDGVLPIEEVEIGDEVYTRHELSPDSPLVVGKVTDIFRSVAPAILWLGDRRPV